MLADRQAEYVAFRAIQSEETARGVRLILIRWARHLSGRPDEEATIRDAQGFLAAHAGQWSASTCYRVSCALRGYYRWLGGPNPWQEVRVRVPSRRIPRVIDAAEWARLEAAMSTIPEEPRAGRRALRRWALLRLAFAAGLRNCELRRLRMEDLDLDHGLVTVRGKGDKERVVPFGGRTASVLRRWLADGRRGFIRGRLGPLFPSERGKAMSASAVDSAMRTAVEASGIERRLYPHLLRHSYATTLLEGGANIREVQQLLGHAHLNTTEIYTYVHPERLQATCAKAFAWAEGD